MDTRNDKTMGIVLTTVTINDRTQLVHLYTKARGRVTCRIALTSRGKQAARLRNMMTPLTQLEVVLSGRPNDAIHSIAEAHILQSPYMLTLQHPDKSAQCLYMAELIAHTVREEERNDRLWNYLTGSLSILENCDEGWEKFHLVFTCGLIGMLGFSIDTEEYCPGCCFDLVEACFTRSLITHPYYFNPVSAEWFCRIFQTRYDTMKDLAITPEQRAALLDMLLAFLAQQIPEMGQLRSVEVLKSISC